MQRLSGLDSMFFYMETPTNHMHVTGVFLLDPTAAPGGFSFVQVRAMVASRLHRAPPLRRRLVEVPLGLAQPVWIEDPGFDLDYHVRRACLPAPGGRLELEQFVGEIVGSPLDRQRPLWEMYLVEGLEGDLQAMVVKVHHAAIDGVSAAELIAGWLDLEADAPLADSDDGDDWQPERVPSEIDLLVGAWAQIASSPPKVARTTRRCTQAALRVATHNRDSAAASPPSPFSAPRTSFNLAISPQRRVCFVAASLEDLRAVKNHFGCTVNDVVLAVCAGALRRFLLVRGELPEEPLVALVPMSVRADEERLTGGNRLSAMLSSLATDIADPVARLHAISAAMSGAKYQESLIGSDVLTDWTEFTFPALIGGVARFISSTRFFDHVRPAFNVTISNIPGPQFPLFLAGARVAATYPLGPVVEGAGLNMTVMSYCGTVYFGLNGCRKTVSGIADLPAMISESLDELLSVVLPGHEWASRADRHPANLTWSN
ncbi:MAG: wax ester/triacylglycerol synthase family O-acyltransferase [Acidimicrobiales bacterium]|jgi:WS/DGAT/MGAT family acyltransferase